MTEEAQTKCKQCNGKPSFYQDWFTVKVPHNDVEFKFCKIDCIHVYLVTWQVEFMNRRSQSHEY